MTLVENFSDDKHIWEADVQRLSSQLQSFKAGLDEGCTDTCDRFAKFSEERISLVKYILKVMVVPIVMFRSLMMVSAPSTLRTVMSG